MYDVERTLTSRRRATLIRRRGWEASLRLAPSRVKCRLVGCLSVVAVGLAAPFGCADAGSEDACSLLEEQLEDLEERFAGDDDQQSWDDVRDMADAAVERDRLRAELARSGCAPSGE